MAQRKRYVISGKDHWQVKKTPDPPFNNPENKNAKKHDRKKGLILFDPFLLNFIKRSDNNLIIKGVVLFDQIKFYGPGALNFSLISYL